jgi:CheY-like chemotaxis protein
MTDPSRRVVLVVEDDADVRESLVEVLEDHDYHPLGAANGQEAIDRLRAGTDRPCLILLDMMMPVMDGRRFRALQQEDPALRSIPVVVLTAHANIQEATDGMEAVGSLRKPVRLDELIDTVRKHCGEG